MIVSLRWIGCSHGIAMRQWYRSGGGSIAHCLPQTYNHAQSAYNLGRISASPARYATS